MIRMKRRITLGEALNFSIISAIAGFLFFLMLSVFLAQIVSDYFLQNITNAMGTLTVITIGGFAVGILISIFISVLVSRYSQRTIPNNYIFASSLLGFVGNIIMWYVISFVGIWIAYPEILNGLYVWEAFIVFPEALTTFGIYIVQPNLTWLWLYAVVTHVVWYGFFIYWLGTPYEGSIKKVLKKEMFEYDK